MQGQRNRPTREELEEDQFLAWVLEAVEYVKERSQLFIGVVAAVIVAILAISYVQSARQEARVEANALLGQAIMADESGRLDEVLRVCEQLTTQYGGTPAAAQATVMLANRYYIQGRYADAGRMYQSYLDDYGDIDMLEYAAWSGLGACYEAQGDLERAAAQYLSYADSHAAGDEAALALMEAARCFAAAGQRDRARQCLERVVGDFADTPIASRARQELNML